MSSPHVKLTIDAHGRGALVMDGVLLASMQNVHVFVKRDKSVKFSIEARLDVEIDAGGETVITVTESEWQPLQESTKQIKTQRITTEGNGS